MKICFYRGSVAEMVSLNIIDFNCKDLPPKWDKYSSFNSIDYVDYLLFTVFLIYGFQIITMVEAKGVKRGKIEIKENKEGNECRNKVKQN